MQTHLYKNDLKDNISFGNIIAIDTEAMGLDPARDRLCLIQLYDGKGDCHMVQFENDHQSSPNLVKLLVDQNIQKIFQFYNQFEHLLMENILQKNLQIYIYKMVKISYFFENY